MSRPNKDTKELGAQWPSAVILGEHNLVMLARRLNGRRHGQAETGAL